MHTAATDGTPGSAGSGRNAFEQGAATLPGVSCPSSVVRSQQRIANSSAHTLDSRLMLRLASSPARISTATWSIDPIRGSRCFSGSSNPAGNAGAFAISFECRVSGMAGAAKRPAALLLAAALLVLGAACGGGGKSSAGTTTEGTTTEAAATTTAATATALPKAAYVTRMKTIGQSLSTSLNSLGAATTAPKAAAALTAVQTDLRKAADRIESITPPQQIKAQHA